MADKLVIVPYDPEWPLLFSQLGSRLREALGPTALRIDHIGSTSIMDLAAKPILDVQISVAEFDPLDLYRLPLEKLGYVFRAANPELTKRYFREQPGEQRTHIHVRRAGSWAEQFALLFRDYMRGHDEDVQAYAKLKYDLAEKYQTDRHRYTDAKEPWIWEIMKKADRWSQETGWEPGPTDE